MTEEKRKKRKRKKDVYMRTTTERNSIKPSKDLNTTKQHFYANAKMD